MGFAVLADLVIWWFVDRHAKSAPNPTNRIANATEIGFKAPKRKNPKPAVTTKPIAKVMATARYDPRFPAHSRRRAHPWVNSASLIPPCSRQNPAPQSRAVASGVRPELY